MRVSSKFLVTNSQLLEIPEADRKTDLWTYLKRNVLSALEDKSELREQVWFQDVNTKESLVYGELLRQVEQLAVKLRLQYGIPPQESVLITTPNHALYPLSLFAVLALGATAVIVPWYLRENMAHEAEQMTARIAIVHNSLLETVESTLKDTDVKIVPMEPCERYNTSIREMLMDAKPVSQQEVDDLEVARKKIDVATHCPILFYSSGTTGNPKPILHNHKSCICYTCITTPLFEHKVCLSSFFFSHVAGTTILLSAILKGFKLRAFSDYNAERDLVKSIIECEATCLTCYARDLIYLSKYADRPDAKSLLSVTKITFGGAPTPTAVLERLRRVLPNLGDLRNAYGMTECGLVTSTQGAEPRYESVGKIAAGCALKVVDLETREAVGPDQKGELCLKTPAMFRKYREPESANSEAFTEDGWFKTGDFGYYDEEEYIYVCNRIADIIRVRKADGSTSYVSPSTIEDGIYAVPQVKHVAVVGEDVEGGPQLPVAFVIKQEGKEISEQEILDLVKNNFKDEPEMHLHRVVFVEDLLMNHAGKISRLGVRKQYHLTKTNATL